MKRLGLLGGMSWESSVVYEQHINRAVRQRLGGVASADLLIRSFNFQDIETLQGLGQWDTASAVLASAAKELEVAGVEAIVLCTNTMHKVADAIEQAIDIPLLHIVEATGRAVKQVGCQKVLLLGTAYTMEQPFYRDALAAQFDLEVIIPPDADRERVHRVIYDELVQGEIRDDSRAAYRNIVSGMQREEGIDGVIAGCTEIELLIGPEDVDVPFFPTTAIHAQFAADFALGVED